MQVMNSHGLQGLLNDYCDGEFFKLNPLYKEDPCALQIQLYYDELELCNPLGSKVKKHKMGKPQCLYNYNDYNYYNDTIA